MGSRTWYARATVATVLLVMVVAVAMMSAGCGSSAGAASSTLKLGQTDDGKTFTVRVGDTIQVVIPGNPTTGYEWTAVLAAKDAALIQQLGEPQYAANNTGDNLVGSGGVFTLTFKAVAKGQATLKLAYARSFESVQPIQTFTATVNIE
jgi:predicted secreted protein